MHGGLFPEQKPVGKHFTKGPFSTTADNGDAAEQPLMCSQCPDEEKKPLKASEFLLCEGGSDFGGRLWGCCFACRPKELCSEDIEKDQRKFKRTADKRCVPD